jgi:hypothetical protein
MNMLGNSNYIGVNQQHVGLGAAIRRGGIRISIHVHMIQIEDNDHPIITLPSHEALLRASPVFFVKTLCTNNPSLVLPCPSVLFYYKTG